MSKKLHLFLVFVLIFMLGTASFTPASAIITNVTDNGKETAEEAPAEQQLFQTITVCANKGSHADFPENSVNAVKNAPSEYVSVYVRLTKDGIPVLMEDETVDRMCVDKDSNAVSGRVDSYTYDEISELFLKARTGGSASKTSYTVASLSELMNIVKNKIIVLDLSFDALDAVLQVVNNDDCRSRVVLRIDGNTDNIIEKLSSYEIIPNVILKYDGNIIFNVNSTIEKAAKSGLQIVQLGTKNSHGVIFYDSVADKIKENNLTAAFSMTGPYNGGREDNVKGWDDAVSHGFTFIETDYPDLLMTYVSNTENATSALDSLIARAETYLDGDYPKDLKYEFSKAYQAAVSLRGRAASQTQLGDAFTSLSKAIESLEQGGNTSTAKSVFHFSAGRIIAVVLCFAAALTAQIYLFKRRRPKKEKEDVVKN